MKMTLITFIFSFFFSVLTAPPNKELCIVTGEVIRPYEAIWQAVCYVESGGERFAIGDKHLKTHSYGIVQIRQSRLDDFYNKTGIRYSLTDMYDTLKSKQVFIYYCQGDYETIARTWNGGEKGMNKKSTVKYWQKVQIKLKTK
jgi:hypothetical protein